MINPSLTSKSERYVQTKKFSLKEIQMNVGFKNYGFFEATELLSQIKISQQKQKTMVR